MVRWKEQGCPCPSDNYREAERYEHIRHLCQAGVSIATVSRVLNSVLATCSTPEITTLDNRVEYTCVTAVAHMIQVFHNRDMPSRVLFSGSIVEHETTHPGAGA